MIFTLPCRTDGAGNRDQPERDKYPGAWNFWPVAPGQTAEIHWNEAAQHRRQHQQKQLRLQTTRTDLALETPRPVHDHNQAALEEAFAIETPYQRRGGDAFVLERLAQQEVQNNATRHRHQAHDHRQVPAMPDRQAVLGQCSAHHRACGGCQQGRHGLRREYADDQARQHQQFDRRTHPARRLMGQVRQVFGCRSEKHIDREAQRIGDAEYSGNGRDDRQRDLDPCRGGNEHRLGKEHFLGQEPVEQRHAGHRCAGDHCQRRGIGKQLHQPAEPPDIPGPALVVDDPGRHEQRGFEGGMVENVEYRSDCRQRAVQAQQQCDQAQVADGRVRQQSFEVILKDRRIGAQNQRASTRTADDPEPLLGAGQRGPHPRHEKHPGLDHGRRV